MLEKWGPAVLASVGVASLAFLPWTVYPTYDDGWNLKLIREMASGDWRQLWHHGSPLFYLFWLPFVQGQLPYAVLCGLNAALGATGIHLLLEWAGCGRLSKTHGITLWTLALLCPITQINLLCFTVEAGGLLLLGLSLRDRHPFWQGALAACACLWNYKLGLIVGVNLLWTIYQFRENLWSRLRPIGLGILATGLTLWLLFNVLTDFAYPLRPPATYLGLLGRNANPDAPSNALDVGFYLRYLLDWDAWHLWALGLVGMWIRFRSRGPELQFVIAVVVIGLGLFLPKAPRWLLPVLPIVLAYVPVLADRLPWTWVRLGVWASFILGANSISWQMERQCDGRIGVPSSMTALSAWTGQHPDTGIIPHGSALMNCMSPMMPNEKESSKDRVHLLDSYMLLTGRDITKLGIPADTLLTTLTETNACPLLWLEHSEFTGLSYSQTLERWRKYKEHCRHVAMVKERGSR